MKSKRKHNMIPFLMLISLLIVIVGIMHIQILFEEEGKEIIEERDEQLFSLAYSVDNNLNLKMKEVSSELDYVVSKDDFRIAEKELLEKQENDLMKTFFMKSHLFEKPDVAGVIVMDGEQQCFSVDQRGRTDHIYTFLDDHDEDPIWICYDERDEYYIAVEKKSEIYDFEYYALFDLTHFHDALIPESIRKTHWVVFYDMESGLSLQNHRNQKPYMIFSEEEIMERQDGYTIILENQKKNIKGSITYEYANYSGKKVPERLITLPSKETINGIFAIGISLDSEKLYSELDKDKRKMMTASLFLAIMLIIFYGFIFSHYEKEARIRYEEESKKKENELMEQLNEARIKNSISQLQPHFLYNALTAIRELIIEAPEYAYDLIYDFTWYLRACVRSISHQDLIPFEDELKNIQGYTNIEQMRFGDGLKITYDIQEKDFKIIPLGVQPLVENSIRHGIVKRRGKKGNVLVKSIREDGWIVISVEDDGLGFDVDKIRQQVINGERDSTGVQNLIFRYEHQMHAVVDITSEPGKGTKVIIRIPMEES